MSIDQFLLSADTTDLNYPEVRPTLDLNFARTKTLDPRIDFTRASGGSYVGADGLIKYAGVNEARFDHDPVTGESLGLLIEESRTNSISNNTMVGAVVGTPGSIPTNWGISTTNAELSSSIVGVGIESGISYIDIKVSGTVTASLSCDILMQSPFISASNGQTWTHSVYLREVGGSQTNISDIRIQGNVYSDTAYITTPWFRAVSVTTESLISQRRSVTATLVGEAITRVGPFIKITTKSSGVVDFTLRIGMPQLELGSFVTSVIPTVGSTRTRQPDNAQITGKDFSDFYRRDEGTVFVQFNLNTNGFTARVFNIDDGTSDNRISGLVGNTFYQTFINPANKGPSIIFPSTFKFKLSSAHKDYDTVNYLNNRYSNLVTGQDIIIPKNLNTFRIGNWQLNNLRGTTISRLTYFPKRLPNAQLQALTR